MGERERAMKAAQQEEQRRRREKITEYVSPSITVHLLP